MADMMSASRAFETNVEVLGRIRGMQQSLLKLGEGCHGHDHLYFGTAAPKAAADTNNPRAARRQSENRDMFTKLLVAQIKNQDPLAPQDPTAVRQPAVAAVPDRSAAEPVADLTSANASVLQSMQTLALGAQVGSDVMVATVPSSWTAPRLTAASS
jgi:hypothetical protein